MKRRAIILRAGAGWLACLLSAGPAWAANGAAGASPGAIPAVPAVATDPGAGIPPSAPIRSPLESEPIRRGGGTGGADGSGTGSNDSPGLDLSRVGLSLAIVLALVFIGRWLMRRFFHQAGGRGSTRAIQVLARAPLAPRQHVVLILVGRRLIVVGDSGSQMTPLCEITDGDEIAALMGQIQVEKSSSPAKAFGALFQRAKHQFDDEEEEDTGTETERRTETDPADTAESQVPELEPTADAVTDPLVADTHTEITGLMAKIRVLSSHFQARTKDSR